MKSKLVIFLFMTGILAQQLSYAQKNDSMDSLSYAVGILLAQGLKNQGFAKVDANSLATGVADVLNDNELAISLVEANQLLQQQQQKQYEGVKTEGDQFLAENAKKEGVVSLPSGLQYKVINEGEGASPAATDKVTVHYHGTLMDGSVFDSSVERGEPTSFPVNGVIQGWVEALQLMKPGSKWKLFIPYQLAYGDRGAGVNIKPFSTLVFEVELISID